MSLILASTSPIRRQMLDAAGVAFEAIAPGLDEEPFKARNERPEQLPLTLA